jgi:acetolactate synthase regulatory subunit
MMTFKSLDPVVLLRDIRGHGLKAGDMGTVVEVYPRDGLEVEFVVASGRTKALLTLKLSDVRGLRGSDMLAVRSVGRRT